MATSVPTSSGAEKISKNWMKQFDKMKFYSGDTEDYVESPHLNVDESEVVWVTHNESIFYANDDGSIGWSDKDHPDLLKKGKGRSIMMPEFLCPYHGRLYLVDNGAKTFITETLQLGKNHIVYWTSEHVIEQENAKLLLAFKQMHPG